MRFFNKLLAVLLLFIAIYCTHMLTNATFGNEYVHIKVHVPKEQAPTIVETEAAIPPAQPHKVIHHYHHGTRSRSRGASKKTHGHGHGHGHKHTHAPLLESVILSELDKPLHMNEHTDYLQHAQEIAEQLSKPVETYIVKKAAPVKVPKKKVNTYTIIEENHKPQTQSQSQPLPTHDYNYNEFEGHGHEHEHGHYKQPHVETFKVIDTKPNVQQQQHDYDFHEQQQQQQHQHENNDIDNFGYDYHSHGKEHYQTIKLIESQTDNYNIHKTAPHRPHGTYYHHHHKKHRKPHGYSKPAPVAEELSETEDDGYGYHYGSGGVKHQKEQQHYFHQKKYAKQRTHAPTPTQAAASPLEAPDVDSYYGAHQQQQQQQQQHQQQYQQHHGNSFKPSPQIFDAQPAAYEEDSYLPEIAAPPATATAPHRQMFAAATGYTYNRPAAAAAASANVDWPEPSGYNNGAIETYSGIDSYSVGHVQGVDSGGYQYTAPYL